MNQDRLTTKIWVDAHVHTCHVQGMPAFVVAKGDESRGGVLLKVNAFGRGVRLFEQSRDFDGGRIWRQLGPADGEMEVDADARVRKKCGFDSDLWVIEIEDMAGEYVPDAPISAL